MKKALSLWLLATVFLATGPVAEAQDGKKIPWIGYLAGFRST